MLDALRYLSIGIVQREIHICVYAPSASHVGASYADFMGIQISTIAAYLGHSGLSTVEMYIHKDWITTITFDALLHKFEEIYRKPKPQVEIPAHTRAVMFALLLVL